MKEFKVGDRVKYTSDNHTEGENNPLWGGEYGYIGGTISDYSSDGGCNVKWDNNGSNYYYHTDLELLDEKPEKVKLTKRGKKVAEDYFLGRGKWARKEDDGELKHGDRVSCTIYNKNIDETYYISNAMVSVDSNGCYHICHNIEECDGHEAEDLCGYEFSWAFEKKDPSERGVTNIKNIL